MNAEARFGEIVTRLMFDYESFDASAFETTCRMLPLKLQRWVATHHPDNRCRKAILRLSNVRIGAGAVVNAGFIVSDDYQSLLTIGERVAISPNVLVICASSPNNSELLTDRVVQVRHVRTLPVEIGDDSWIGAGAIILPGVRIGRRCIIGAGAIVTRDVADSAIAAGCPARVMGASGG
ncbi:MAG: DapH/DapD/GlmU-related protein [Candidatus Omnitrophota bacterium]|jgi:maltose O-acetyltransferase